LGGKKIYVKKRMCDLEMGGGHATENVACPAPKKPNPTKKGGSVGKKLAFDVGGEGEKKKKKPGPKRAAWGVSYRGGG